LACYQAAFKFAIRGLLATLPNLSGGAKKAGKLKRELLENQARPRPGQRSTLSLFVAWLRANHPDHSVTFDDFALAANAFY